MSRKHRKSTWKWSQTLWPDWQLQLQPQPDSHLGCPSQVSRHGPRNIRQSRRTIYLSQSTPRTVRLDEIFTILARCILVWLVPMHYLNKTLERTPPRSVVFNYSWALDHIESQWGCYLQVTPQAEDQLESFPKYTPSLRADYRRQHHPSSECCPHYLVNLCSSPKYLDTWGCPTVLEPKHTSNYLSKHFSLKNSAWVYQLYSKTNLSISRVRWDANMSL